VQDERTKEGDKQSTEKKREATACGAKKRGGRREKRRGQGADWIVLEKVKRICGGRGDGSVHAKKGKQNKGVEAKAENYREGGMKDGVKRNGSEGGPCRERGQKWVVGKEEEDKERLREGVHPPLPSAS